MENTIENAKKFMAGEDIKTLGLARTMVAYAEYIEINKPAASIRPATVSEEEIRLEVFKRYLLFDPTNESGDKIVDAFREGARWALSKQTSIVLPEKMVKSRTDTQNVTIMVKPWNACIESIKHLNPTARFVSGGDKTESI